MSFDGIGTWWRRFFDGAAPRQGAMLGWWARADGWSASNERPVTDALYVHAHVDRSAAVTLTYDGRTFPVPVEFPDTAVARVVTARMLVESSGLLYGRPRKSRPGLLTSRIEQILSTVLDTQTSADGA